MSADEKQLATRQEEPSVALMLQGMLERGVTGESVETLGKLMDLYERSQDRQAKRDFAAAFAAMQSEMPKVQATRVVKNKDGSVRYTFAPYEDIMEQARPFLMKHGFSIKFDSRIEETRIVAICKLIHVSGYSEENSFACRIGSGPPGSSESQADGSADSYAKRFALSNALNVVVEHIDDDARLSSAPVDFDTAKALRARVELLKKSTSFDEEQFFKLAGAQTYEAIPQSKYDLLDDTLFAKERAAKIRDTKGNWLV